MAFSLIGYYESSAKNGLTATAAAPGEDLFTINGDDILINKDHRVKCVGAVSAGVANVDTCRFRRTTDPDWQQFTGFVSDITGVKNYSSYFDTNYALPDGSTVVCEINNLNNAQIDSLFMIVDDGNAEFSVIKPDNLPEGARWIHGAGAGTAVAGTWTNFNVTWNFSFDRQTEYAIVGFQANAAVLYAWRLRPGQGSNFGDARPGWIGGVSNVTTMPLYFKNADLRFGGNAPPNMQVLCSGASTAANIDMLVVPLDEKQK